MPTSFLEIVELNDGEIVLQRADEESEGDSEALVTIKFSEKSKAYMAGSCLDVAKIMIQAGIQASAQIDEMALDSDESVDDDARTYH